MVPVHQGVVKANTKALSASRLHVLPDDVPPRSLLRSAVVSQLRVKVTEPFVVLRGHHHILHSGGLRELCPGTGTIRSRMKVGCVSCVRPDRPRLILHYPLMTPDCAVNAEVDEHPEAGSVPPLRSLSASALLHLVRCCLHIRRARCYTTLRHAVR